MAALASFGVKPKELALAPRISRLIRDARPEPAAEPCDHGRRYSRALRAGRADLRSPQPRLANGCSADGGCADSSTAFRIWLQGAPVLPQADRVEQRIAWLDAKNIDYQLVATWPDIYGYSLAPERCVVWHRLLNDTLASWCADNAARFGFTASVPLPGAEAAAAELGRAVEIGAVGVMVPANIEGVNVGELELDAFWAKAEQVRLPVILHPVMVASAPRAAKFALAQSVQYTFDTTLGIGSLLFSGVLDRFPRLELVLAHGGGAYPYLAGRLDVMHARMDRQAQGDVAARAPSEYLSSLAYDSIVHSAKSLRFLADLVGIDRLLLGTDYSFPPADLDPLDSLRAAGFGPAEVQAIACDNARRIFSRIVR